LQIKIGRANFSNAAGDENFAVFWLVKSKRTKRVILGGWRAFYCLKRQKEDTTNNRIIKLVFANKTLIVARRVIEIQDVSF
jgi:hypothetical protein